MKIRPLGTRVVLQQCAADDRTAGGLLLANQSWEKPEMFTVIEVGPGVGKKTEETVKVGETVLVAANQGVKTSVGGKEYKIVEFESILAVME